MSDPLPNQCPKCGSDWLPLENAGKGFRNLLRRECAACGFTIEPDETLSSIQELADQLRKKR